MVRRKIYVLIRFLDMCYENEGVFSSKKKALEAQKYIMMNSSLGGEWSIEEWYLNDIESKECRDI